MCLSRGQGKGACEGALNNFAGCPSPGGRDPSAGTPPSHPPSPGPPGGQLAARHCRGGGRQQVAEPCLPGEQAGDGSDCVQRLGSTQTSAGPAGREPCVGRPEKTGAVQFCSTGPAWTCRPEGEAELSSSESAGHNSREPGEPGLDLQGPCPLPLPPQPGRAACESALTRDDWCTCVRMNVRSSLGRRRGGDLPGIG